MNNNIVSFIAGLIIGGLAVGFAIYKSSPGILLEETQSKYDLEESLAVLQAEVDKTGWGISNKHDLQATLLKHDKENIGEAVVVELCNPDLAEGILQNDEAKIVSNMMPCRVAFYEKSDGNIYYSRMNSGLMGKAMGGVVEDKMTVAFEEMEEFLSVIMVEN